MLNFFKKEQPKSKSVFVTAPVEVKTENQIIEEIHLSIDSAQDLLLEEALKVLNLNKIPEEDIAKGERLRRLGFSSTKEVLKLNEADTKTAASRELSENIIHYKQRYPFLKFLTITELDRICNKYGLIYSKVWNYIGSVPEKNLLEIENAQPLDPADYAYQGSKARFKNKNTGEVRPFNFLWEMYTDVPTILDSNENPKDWLLMSDSDKSWLRPTVNDPHLEIAAPEAMFKKDARLVMEGNALVQKDPIVFRRVRGGIQVITKWGIEASDSALQNPINN